MRNVNLHKVNVKTSVCSSEFLHRCVRGRVFTLRDCEGGCETVLLHVPHRRTSQLLVTVSTWTGRSHRVCVSSPQQLSFTTVCFTNVTDILDFLKMNLFSMSQSQSLHVNDLRMSEQCACRTKLYCIVKSPPTLDQHRPSTCL